MPRVIVVGRKVYISMPRLNPSKRRLLYSNIAKHVRSVDANFMEKLCPHETLA